MDAKKLNDRLRVEEPCEFPAASFGMDDPKQEARLVSKLKHDPRAHVIDRSGGLDLIKVDRTIFIEDERGLAYFVEWEDCNDFILPGRHCIRMAVWRRAGAGLPGIGGYVFWNHLFPIHGTVITDAKQTANGRRFWGDRIAQALEGGLYVYRVNLAQKKRDRITTILEYVQWCDQMFGLEIGREEERLVITDQPRD